jgi:hypothetical protein
VLHPMTLIGCKATLDQKLFEAGSNPAHLTVTLTILIS